MARPSQNILRRQVNVKTYIIMFSVLFFLLFLLVSYFGYRVLNYEYVHGKVNELSGYILAASDSSPFQLLFFNALGGILLFHVKVWWVYLSTACIVFIFMTSRNRNDFKNMEHGSARWANKEEIKRFQKDKTGIPLAKDTYLPLKSNYAANLNEVVIGGSGAGKSFRKAKPDIIQMNGSYVITDPKGELYRDCAKVLKKNGYKIRVLNLVNVNFSNSYNPFAYVTSEQDVVRIANLFMKNTAGEGEKADFFSEAAGKLLVALMLYLFKSENEIKTFGRVIRLLNSIRYTNGSIDQSCELARCMNKHASRFPNDAASINWSGMQGNAQETQSSINEVLSTRLQLWATTDLDAITSTDEMDFESIGKEKTAIFLIIPAARNPYKAVINIFYCHNIRICIVLQGLSQLKAIYEKTYDSIIGNCDVFTLLGSKDKDTLDYVSDKLGKITARNDSRSFNRSGTQGGGGQDTEAVAERPLLYPDEIKQAIKPKGESKKYGGNAIVFVGYEYPMFLPKFDTFNHPLFKECGSKYEGYTQNCTDVEKEYAPIWENRLKEYQKMYHEYAASEEASKKEYEEMTEAENHALEEAFANSNPVAPPDLIPTEEEYERNAQVLDKPDYDHVEDFDDEADEECNNVAPIVGELMAYDENQGGE